MGSELRNLIGDRLSENTSVYSFMNALSNSDFCLISSSSSCRVGSCSSRTPSSSNVSSVSVIEYIYSSPIASNMRYAASSSAFCGAVSSIDTSIVLLKICRLSFCILGPFRGVVVCVSPDVGV